MNFEHVIQQLGNNCLEMWPSCIIHSLTPQLEYGQERFWQRSLTFAEEILFLKPSVKPGYKN